MSFTHHISLFLNLLPLLLWIDFSAQIFSCIHLTVEAFLKVDWQHEGRQAKIDLHPSLSVHLSATTSSSHNSPLVLWLESLFQARLIIPLKPFCLSFRFSPAGHKSAVVLLYCILFQFRFSRNITRLSWNIIQFLLLKTTASWHPGPWAVSIIYCSSTILIYLDKLCTVAL